MNDDILSDLEIKEASMCKVNDIVNVLLDSNYQIIKDVFGDNKIKAEKLLKIQYEYDNPGTFVLFKKDKAIGIMKIHLPKSKVGRTLSISTLIRYLGFGKAIRAILLLSNWDEYKLKAGEAYIEFISILTEYQNQGYEKILLDKAIDLASKSEAKFITVFSGVKQTNNINLLKDNKFIKKRSISSPLAKLYGVTSKWYKFRYDIPDSVRMNLQQAYQALKRRYEYREARSALQLSLWMLIVPIIGGSLAYFRGFTLAGLWWVLLFIFHIIGILVIYYEKSMIGKYLISIVMLLEAGNLLQRMILTNVWLDRVWLVTLAFVDLWISFMILRVSKFSETLATE